MTISEILFWFLTALAILSALMVIFSRNPVHSVLWLIFVFVAISGHYILLNAQFLAIVNLIVYAGAIMVLFLFVIMLMNMNTDYGPPFITEQATREDREAIEQFTDQLSASMSPLIIQIDEEGYEKHYDVLASVYMRCVREGRPQGKIHDDLVSISTWINQHDKHKTHLKPIHEFIHLLRKNKLADAIYFPDLLLMNRVVLTIVLVLKVLWLVAGGWIWRVVRGLIFSKIKANTFKSPVSVGAAMVIYPLITLILMVVCLIAGWPVWYILVWLFVMWTGIFFRPSLLLIWSVFVLKVRIKQELVNHVTQTQACIQLILQIK